MFNLVLPHFSAKEIDDFQTSLIVDRKCSQGLADYIINSDSFTLDECLNESYRKVN